MDAIVGVVVGGLIGLIGSWLPLHHAENRRRRERLEEAELALLEAPMVLIGTLEQLTQTVRSGEKVTPADANRAFDQAYQLTVRPLSVIGIHGTPDLVTVFDQLATTMSDYVTAYTAVPLMPDRPEVTDARRTMTNARLAALAAVRRHTNKNALPTVFDERLAKRTANEPDT